MKYSSSTIKKVADGADIRDFIPGCDPKKADQMVDCPFCGAKKLSVVYKRGKNFAHCFACQKGFPNAIDATMHYSGLQFLEALESVARQSNIYIEPEDQEVRKLAKSASSKNAGAFYLHQLASSGLSEEDVMARTIDRGGNEIWCSPFAKGGFDERFVPNGTSDEMLIRYYGLDGKIATYTTKGSSARQAEYIRVRWSNPDIHQGKDGKPMKYQTPPGAPSRCYIPQKIRQSFQNATPIDTLFIQEGEKKAEKACKHGIPSLGIQGINNFGSKTTGMFQDIQDVVKSCNVHNIVLLMDADWGELSSNITSGDAADTRPNSFSKAVIKFKQFSGTFHSQGLSVDCWWGHVNHNDGNDKGIDDLLANTLKGREAELAEDIDKAMHAHDGAGRYVDIHKITAVSDSKIEDWWHLNSSADFFEAHRERLQGLETFKFRRILYKIEDGTLIQANRYSSTTEFWELSYDKEGNAKVSFDGQTALDFLRACGFYRLRSRPTEADGASSYEIIHIEDGVISRSSTVDVRDFVFNYVRQATKSPTVLGYFAQKLDIVLSDKKIERLDCIENSFNNFELGTQRTYYANGQVVVTANEITPCQPMEKVWKSRIIKRNFTRTEIMKITKSESDGFDISLTSDGAKCEFLQFLMNASNSFFSPDEPRKLTKNEADEYVRHIVNKITSIGYLLSDYKLPTERKAVVVQDHEMSEVGQSYGGSGKSLLGAAIGHVTSQVFIDGKRDSDERFIFERVSNATRNILIDDVKTNFNFERLFALVTGDMIIERKNIAPLTIPQKESPKFLITTNHAINKAEEGSTRRRISYMEFSNWYNSDHTIINEFHHMFFDDWDDYQWNLFDNLMMECVMYYLRSLEQKWGNEGEGAVPPPMENIMLRTLRQEIGEVMLQWGEEFYDPSGVNLNERKSRKEIYEAFTVYAKDYGRNVTPSNFRKKLVAFCRYEGYDLNPSKKNKEGQWFDTFTLNEKNNGRIFEGLPDKANGQEYFTVSQRGSKAFGAENQKPF